MWKRAPLLVAMVLVVLCPANANAGGGGGSCAEPPSDGHSTTVEMKAFCFNPSVVRVRVDETVTFVNRDGEAHMIIGQVDSFMDGEDWGAWNELGPEKSIAFQFQAKGTYPFVCMYHVGMVGAVVVGDGVFSGNRNMDVVDPVEPVVETEPLIFHIPKAMDEPAESSVAGTAALVWGGAAGGFLGGLVLLWAARRSDRREP